MTQPIQHKPECLMSDARNGSTICTCYLGTGVGFDEPEKESPKQKCCDKCNDSIIGGCDNMMCPCHQESTKEECACKKAGYKVCCLACKTIKTCLCGTPKIMDIGSLQQESSWEKEFYGLFADWILEICKTGEAPQDNTLMNRTKDFIRKEKEKSCQEERTALIEKVEHYLNYDTGEDDTISYKKLMVVITKLKENN